MFLPYLPKIIRVCIAAAVVVVAVSAGHARVPVKQGALLLRNNGAVLEKSLSKNAVKAAPVSAIAKESIKIATPAQQPLAVKTAPAVAALSVQKVADRMELALQNTPKPVCVWSKFSTDVGEIEPQPLTPIGNMHTNTLRNAQASFLFHKYIRQGFSKTQAFRKVTEELGPRPSKAWPATTQGTLEVSSLQGLTLDGVTGKMPLLPIPSNRIYLYRGMGLDEDGLRGILQNGLRVEDVQASASAVDIQARLLSVGTMPVSADILTPFASKQIYLAPQADYALHFAYTNSFENGKIPVMVVVKSKWRNGNGNHVVTENIPADDFAEVAALVNGPTGTPIWCKVSLAQDGQGFVFAPYIHLQ
jgi:hypothetical protein